MSENSCHFVNSPKGHIKMIFFSPWDKSHNPTLNSSPLANVDYFSKARKLCPEIELC